MGSGFSFEGSATGNGEPTLGDGTTDGIGATNFVDPAGTPGDRDAGGDDFAFDPERHISLDKRNADGSYRRKRRRKSGDGGPASKPRKAANRSDYASSVDALANVLVVAHAGLSVATKTPELAIEEAEGKALAGALANVMAEFDIRPDPKVEAMIGLVIVASTMYGPRLYLIRERVKKARATAKEAAPVLHFPNRVSDPFNQ